jgi:hypothetical protein
MIPNPIRKREWNTPQHGKSPLILPDSLPEPQSDESLPVLDLADTAGGDKGVGDEITDPLIQGLVDRLPKPEARGRWMIASNGFGLRPTFLYSSTRLGMVRAKRSDLCSPRMKLRAKPSEWPNRRDLSMSDDARRGLRSCNSKIRRKYPGGNKSLAQVCHPRCCFASRASRNGDRSTFEWNERRGRQRRLQSHRCKAGIRGQSAYSKAASSRRAKRQVTRLGRA